MTKKKVDINIPMDLTVEILKKLPTKSLMRFQCVSKQWSSIISSRKDFIESIIARSVAQPDTKLIFHRIRFSGHDFFTFSSTYSENIDKKESVSSGSSLYQYVRGLILFWQLDFPSGLAIYNPTTRQCFPLPNSPHESTSNCLFGYDPLENRYKVLCLSKLNMDKEICKVFTLGDSSWRKIESIGLHHIIYPAVCINGTIYYRATTTLSGTTCFLVSFDVRSENFARVEAPKTHHVTTLIKYQGKLGIIMCCQNGVEIWVMEDGDKKQEWSKIIHYEMKGFEAFWIGGVTHGGEIVFISRVLLPRNNNPLYVYYYDPKRNSLKCVEVEGTRVKDIEHKRKHFPLVYAVPDHVENTMRL